MFADLGFIKFRLTGGELTVRTGIVDIVHHLSAGLHDVVMTTSAMRLAALVQPLSDAGLKRVNISLDTLNAQTFHRMTNRGDFEKVWADVIAAERAGLTPIKMIDEVLNIKGGEIVMQLIDDRLKTALRAHQGGQVCLGKTIKSVNDSGKV